MEAFNSLIISIFLVIALHFTPTHEANFEIRNNCPFTVWAAAVPGGGQRLDRGQSWNINVAAGTTGARIWARTGCNFDGSGRGSCQTGDCGGVLRCTAYGAQPNTLAEFALNQFNNLDFYDISLIDGFNVGMDFSPTSNGCTRGIRCAADITGQCPNDLRVPGGCNNPCKSGSCSPSNRCWFFKQKCPDVYTCPSDDQTGTVVFTCPGGTNYRVVFCP